MRPNGLRQADFFQFETTIEDTWRLYNVVDYATKLALACPVSTTRGDIETAEALQGRPLVEDRADEATGELVPLMVVTDNGLAMKSVAVARWFAGRPHLSHVRTRHRDPHTQTEPAED